MLRVSQLRLSLDEELDCLKEKLAQKLHIAIEDIVSYEIVKESIDARKKDDIFITYSVDACIAQEERVLKRHYRDVVKAKKEIYPMPKKGVVGLMHRPIVVGFGPAGMFAALLVAQMGYRPLVLERGECVEKRVESVNAFWKTGMLNEESNVQFGEGGAGTFSDGKLTTRVKDLRVRKVLEEFVRFGAEKEIVYQAHPHIGTDVLRGIVKNIRKEIIRLGGEIRFETKLEDISYEKGMLRGIVANGEYIPCEQMILALGHSARDTFAMLMERGFPIRAKAFAIGARIEHPQALINQAQYGAFANHKRLKAAEYRLVHTASNGRGVYTFCMCPGGVVVPSTSQKGHIVVNGMSEHARDRENANSAVLVQVHTDDFDNDPRLGIRLQEEIEKKAFEAAHHTYLAPAQRVEDFLQKKTSTALGNVRPSYALGVTLANLHDILPDYVCEAMVEGIQAFDHKLKGFAMADALLTGVETRSSSPIRIERKKENCMCLDIEGVYPCGEGAGYAGGIVSAAIDGLRCAEKLIEVYTYDAQKEECGL